MRFSCLGCRIGCGSRKGRRRWGGFGDPELLFFWIGSSFSLFDSLSSTFETLGFDFPEFGSAPWDI